MGDFFEGFGKMIAIAFGLLAYGTIHHLSIEYSKKEPGKDTVFPLSAFVTPLVVAFFYFGLVVTQSKCSN